MPWSEHQAATTNDFVRQETLAVAKRRPFLGALFRHGRVTYDWDGIEKQWPLRYKRATMQPFGDGDSVTFARVEKRKKLTMPLRSYVLGESINEFDLQINKNRGAIIKLWANKTEEMIDDIRAQFNKKLIQSDGYAAGSEREIMGLDAAFGKGSASGNNLTFLPSDTYAGRSTALAGLGGTWTGTWPEGSGDEQYDAHSPLITDQSGSAWSGNWAAQSEEHIGYVIINTERNGYTPTFILLAKNLYNDHINNMRASQRTVVYRTPDSDAPKVGFGFSPLVIQQDGVELTWDTDVVASKGYALCLEEMYLDSSQSQLFVAKMDYDIETTSDRIKLQFFGNLIIEALRCQAKIDD